MPIRTNFLQKTLKKSQYRTFLMLKRIFQTMGAGVRSIAS